MKRTMLSVLLPGLLSVFATPALAAPPYPVRPVEIIVPYSAGGGTDLSARVMAQVMEKYLGGTIVVVNKPGGSGSIGVSAVKHARPDGYTLGMGAQGPLAIMPHFGGVDYTKDDFDYLTLMGRNLMLIAVGKDAPFQDAKSMIAYAKANPGKVTIGVSGAAGANRIATEGFALAAGAQVKCMPFNGSAPAITAAVGGHINGVTAHPSELINQVKAGNLKVILAMSDQRVKEFPDAPTTKEAGVDFEWAAWKGVIAPLGLPPEVRAKLSDALDKTFKDPAFIEKMNNLGEYIDYIPNAGFKKLADKDSVIAERVIKSLGMYGVNKK